MIVLYIFVGGLAIWLLYSFVRSSHKGSSAVQIRPYEKEVRLTNGPEIADFTKQSSDPIDKDEWEGSFWEVTQPLSAKARLRMKYTDGAGKKSERSVDVKQFGAIGTSTLLIGHCHMRDATRTFRVDRIETCVDEETGQVVNDVRAYLECKYAESPNRTKDQLVADEFDTLRILLFVGKADGQLRAAEKEVIRDTCIAISNDTRLTVQTIEELFNEMDVPTLQAFKLAVGRLAKRDQSSKAIVAAAVERIISTQTTIHSAEQEALDYIKKRFAENNSDA